MLRAGGGRAIGRKELHEIREGQNIGQEVPMRSTDPSINLGATDHSQSHLPQGLDINQARLTVRYGRNELIRSRDSSDDFLERKGHKDIAGSQHVRENMHGSTQDVLQSEMYAREDEIETEENEKVQGDDDSFVPKEDNEDPLASLSEQLENTDDRSSREVCEKKEPQTRGSELDEEVGSKCGAQAPESRESKTLLSAGSKDEKDNALSIPSTQQMGSIGDRRLGDAEDHEEQSVEDTMSRSALDLLDGMDYYEVVAQGTGKAKTETEGSTAESKKFHHIEPTLHVSAANMSASTPLLPFMSPAMRHLAASSQSPTSRRRSNKGGQKRNHNLKKGLHVPRESIIFTAEGTMKSGSHPTRTRGPDRGKNLLSVSFSSSSHSIPRGPSPIMKQRDDRRSSRPASGVSSRGDSRSDNRRDSSAAGRMLQG